jgi:hypothetical protein
VRNVRIVSVDRDPDTAPPPGWRSYRTAADLLDQMFRIKRREASETLRRHALRAARHVLLADWLHAGSRSPVDHDVQAKQRTCLSRGHPRYRLIGQGDNKSGRSSKKPGRTII